MGELASMFDKAAGKTKWELVNADILELVNKYKDSGIASDIIVENHVPGGMNCFFILAPNSTRDIENECFILFKSILKKYNISDDEIIDDHNIGIRWARSREILEILRRHANMPNPMF